MAHTPGPWVVRYDRDELPSVETHDGHHLCTPFAGARVEPGMYWMRARANAHLIAAAPELLEACEEMLRLWAHRAEYDDERAAVSMARQAIAKARGETP